MAVCGIDTATVAVTGKAYDLRQTRSTLTFNHAPVNGSLFKGAKWADTGTMVSADQAAGVTREIYRQGLSGVWFQNLVLFITTFYWFSSVLQRITGQPRR